MSPKKPFSPERLLAAFAAALCLSGYAYAAEVAKAEAPKSAPAAKSDLVGSEACLACHADRAEYKKTTHGKAWASVKKIGSEQACETCHGAGSQHAAAAGDRNNPGFSTIKSGKELAADDGSCLSCHKQKNLMMWGTSAHKQNGVSCAKCHSMHDGEGRKMLAKGATEGCVKCHAKQRADMRLPSHHPVPEGKMSCTSCHNPHGGIEGNLKADSGEELCAKCHSEKVGPFAFPHAPIEEGCGSCHVVHGSVNERLLKQQQQYLCVGCHVKVHSQTTKDRILGKSRCTDCHQEIHGSDRSATFKH
ncbi:MAG: DmsE family decaheme c-type cytochrome [Elusimicrobiota bacterium]|jgi:DmsE family decaheme c-type cytochrome